jgi:uncharacterized RDD family membrane protein YckC
VSTLESSVRFGGLGRRTVAFFLDVALEVSIMLPVGYLIGAALESAGANFAGIVSMIIGLLFDSVYFTLFESSSLQASPGKWLTGMKVADLEGRRISYLRACVRYMGKVLSAVLLFAGFVMVAFHRRKQGLHDVIAQTLVLRVPLPLTFRTVAANP